MPSFVEGRPASELAPPQQTQQAETVFLCLVNVHKSTMGKWCDSIRNMQKLNNLEIKLQEMENSPKQLCEIVQYANTKRLQRETIPRNKTHFKYFQTK